jgi:protein-tyrosine phosphatase
MLGIMTPTPDSPVPSDNRVPPPRDRSRPYRVCFVCLGNICRSPMAEVVARAALAESGLGQRVSVDSAGTGDWHIGEPMNKCARDCLARRGYDGDAHRARQFEASWLADADLVLAMDNSNFANLRSMSRTPLSCSAPANATGAVPLAVQDSSSSRIRLFGELAGLSGAEVPDPYGGSPAEFDRVLDMLESAMPALVARLSQVLNPA